MPGIDIRYTTRNQETFDGYLTGADGDAKAPGILLDAAQGRLQRRCVEGVARPGASLFQVDVRGDVAVDVEGRRG